MHRQSALLNNSNCILLRYYYYKVYIEDHSSIKVVVDKFKEVIDMAKATYTSLEDGRLACDKCSYTWTPRKPNKDPAECPYCKRHFRREAQEVKLMRLTEVPPTSMLNCTLCGEPYKKYLPIDDIRVCEDCVTRLVKSAPKVGL